MELSYEETAFRMISGIVLAAGAAKRMGQEKLFLDLRGRPVLEWALSAALSSSLDEVVCVVSEIGPVKEKLGLKKSKLRWIENRRASEGLSTSVIAGLGGVVSNADAAVFMVGDQPFLSPELINALIRLYRKNPAPIVAPMYRGQTRNPVLFAKEIFPELLQLTGDRGGKALIEQYRGRASFLRWEDESPFLDLDTWEDYERLKRYLRGTP